MIYSESDLAYFKNPSMSFHKLMDFNKSPQYFLRKHIQGTIPDTKSKAMAFGSWLHMACLEPERFRDTVNVAPPEALTPSGMLSESERAMEFLKKTGKNIASFVSPAEYAELLDMAECYQSALNRVTMKDNSPRTLYETERIFYANRVFGKNIEVKAKIDIILNEHVFDLKSIASLDDVYDSVERFNYIEQIVFYAEISWNKPGGIIFVERGNPSRFLIVEIGEHTRISATDRIMRSLDKYKECLETGTWPRTNQEFISI